MNPEDETRPQLSPARYATKSSSDVDPAMCFRRREAGSLTLCCRAINVDCRLNAPDEYDPGWSMWQKDNNGSMSQLRR
jgi:hypothetical protein